MVMGARRLSAELVRECALTAPPTIAQGAFAVKAVFAEAQANDSFYTLSKRLGPVLDGEWKGKPGKTGGTYAGYDHTHHQGRRKKPHEDAHRRVGACRG